MGRHYWLMLFVLFLACIFGIVGCTGPLVGLYIIPTASGDKAIEKSPVKDAKNRYAFNFIDKDGKIREAQDMRYAELQLFEEYGFPEEIVIETGAGPKRIKPVFQPFSTFTIYDGEDWNITSKHKGEEGVWRFKIEIDEGQFWGKAAGFIEAREELYFRYGKPACFPAGTFVITKTGPRSVSEVRAGDQIMSLDEKGGTTLTEVVRIYESDNNHYYLINNKLKVTGLHRFLTSAGWKRAYDIDVGDKLKTSRQDDFEEVFSKERVVTEADFKVYNLQVSHAKNFIISPDGHSTYVVHNCGNGGNGEDELLK